MRSTLDRVCGWALLTLIFRPVAYGIFVASARHYVSLRPFRCFTSARFVAAGDAPKNSQRTAAPTGIHIRVIFHKKRLVAALQDDSVRIMPKAWLPIPLQRALGFAIACAVSNAVIHAFPIFPAVTMPERATAFLRATAARLI